MAEQMPWEMDWQAQSAPKAAPSAGVKPWEMDWQGGQDIEAPPVEVESTTSEGEAMGLSRSRQDQILQSIEEAPDMFNSRQQQEAVLQSIEQDAAEQQKFFEEAMSQAAETGMMEQSRDAQDQYLAEIAEQKRILGSILNQVTSGQSADLQNSAERALMQRSRARQDAILKSLKAGKPKARPRQVVPRGTNAQQLEAQLRDLQKREVIAGHLSLDAEANRDKAAWERAQKIMDRLFDQREQILKDLRKKDPKRADELYDELYIKGFR